MVAGSESGGLPSSGGGLPSPAARRVYGRITRREPVDVVARRPELDELLLWGLIAYTPGDPGALPVAVDPMVAAEQRWKSQMGQMAAQLEEMAALPGLLEVLGEDYRRSQSRVGPGSEYLGEAEVVNARLDQVVGSAEREILAAQPGGPRTRELLERAVRRDTEAVDRGVVKKTLYRDCVRDDVVTGEGARVMSARGAEYRTLVSPFERCIIVDRQHAFVSDHTMADGPPHAAWHITDRAAVAVMAEVFGHTWQRASPWKGELRTAGGRQQQAVRSVGEVRTTEIQREILRDMVSGTTQAATAGRLGISVRTLQRELDQVREMTGASSPAELGYWWALSDDRLVDDRIDAVSGPGENAVA